MKTVKQLMSEVVRSRERNNVRARMELLAEKIKFCVDKNGSIPESLKKKWNALADEIRKLGVITPKYYVCSERGHVFIPYNKHNKWKANECIYCDMPRSLVVGKNDKENTVELQRILDRL